MSAVKATHPEYDQHCPRWQLVQDVVDTNVTNYLRTIDKSDKARSWQYKANAILTNFTARTKHGLVGLMFREDPEVDLPNELEYLIGDATGDNLPLDQLAKFVSGEVLEAGRIGLLVDFPEMNEDVPTQADVEAMDGKARITQYEACSIRNWDKIRVGSRTLLSLVVLSETANELAEDGYTWIQKERFRILQLIDGIYTQVVVDEAGNALTPMTVPTKQDGSLWNEIPFITIGSENNDIAVDNSPLYDLALLNIGHYRNSADQEENGHMTGQATLVLKNNLSPDEWKTLNPNGVSVGATNGLQVGIEGDAYYLQTSPNQVIDVMMKRKEEQAVMIGAKIITPTTGNETAEAARMRHGSEISVLNNIAINITMGMTQAIEWAGEFMGTDEEITYEVNTKFFDDTVSPQTIVAMIQLADRGIVANDDVRGLLRKGKIIDPNRTDEDIEADTEAANPLITNVDQEDDQ